MNRYTVAVDYSARVYFEIDADSPEAAEALALKIANRDVPYDNLYVEVAYIDEDEVQDED